MAKKDATLLAEKSSDHSMVRIRLLGHLDMMPESPIRTERGAPACVGYVPKVNPRLLDSRSGCGDDSDHASDGVQCGNDLVGKTASAVPGIVEDDQAAARPAPVQGPSRIQRS